MIMRPRANAAVIVGWKSPVDGKVSVSLDVAEVNGADPLILELSRNEESAPLHTESIPAGSTAQIASGTIEVKKGDFLYLVADAKPRSDSPFAMVENLRVKLETLND
jgi:hypothetical protein